MTDAKTAGAEGSDQPLSILEQVRAVFDEELEVISREIAELEAHEPQHLTPVDSQEEYGREASFWRGAGAAVLRLSQKIAELPQE